MNVMRHRVRSPCPSVLRQRALNNCTPGGQRNKNASRKPQIAVYAHRSVPPNPYMLIVLAS